MLRISSDIKLDFNDVLLVPQRSGLSSRSQVILEREYTFAHAKRTWTGIGIVAANMAVVGTFAMAKEMAKKKCLTALHKYYSVEQLVEFFYNNRDLWDYVFYTVGSSEEDYSKLSKVKKILAEKITGEGTSFQEESKYHEIMRTFPYFLCIDVANGYQESFVDVLKEYRRFRTPESIIMAGNVVTPNMAEELILSGADISKVGIGSGCFIKGTLVNTETGLKKIEEIKVGDNVFTHKNKLSKVVGTLVRDEKEKIISINDIKCTKNHEFYVLKKEFKDLVNDENIHKYATWVSAEELNSDFFLIKMLEKYELIEIKSKEEIEFSGQVYDIEVKEDHSYCIDGIIVHNSVCTTRIQTGCGFPQLSSTSECAFSVHGKPNGHICSDGGITNPGDACKAFASGADFIMIGGMFSGLDENEGEWEFESSVDYSTKVPSVKSEIKKKRIKFYGMSSEFAQDKFNGGMEDYKSSEGRLVYAEYKGSAEKTINSILGGIRSCCSYLGAEKLKYLPKCAQFIRVNNTHNRKYEGQEIKG